jgi:hypothetical protein
MGGLRTSAPSGEGFYAIPFVGAKSQPDNCGIENIYICDNYGADPDTPTFPDPDDPTHWDDDLGLLGGEDLAGVDYDQLMNGTYNDPAIDNSGAVIENYPTANPDTWATIPYERPFVIVVAVRIEADADNVYTTKENQKLVAYVNRDNMYVYLDWSPNMFGDGYENSQEEEQNGNTCEHIFDNSPGIDWTIPNQPNDGTGPDDWARVNVVFANTDGIGGTDYQGFQLNAGDTLNLDEVELWVWA